MAQERKKNRQQQTEAQRLAHRDAVIEHSDNKFVAELTKNMDAFIYTKTSMLHCISSLKVE